MEEESASRELFMTTFENKLPFGYGYIGEQTVKNIAKPVRVYRVLMEPGVTIPRVTAETEVKTKTMAEDSFNCWCNSNCNNRRCCNMETLHKAYSSN